ncbi:hypothetical protein N0V83_001948 [Neocucurbitaria cava]|uniref:Uncharacterized protein n=1 Tax=Neocucurbitaria cava TaxID=798079 RepID=A0A9W9CPK7_9PLEO|nr:hypothetical protein N0V83_001948 [Neocucurbitaria cava]
MASSDELTAAELTEVVCNEGMKLFPAQARLVIAEEVKRKQLRKPTAAEIKSMLTVRDIICRYAQTALARQDLETLRRLHANVLYPRGLYSRPIQNAATPAASRGVPSTSHTSAPLQTFSEALAGARKPTIVQDALARGGCTKFPPPEPKLDTFCPKNEAKEPCDRQTCGHWHEDQVTFAKTQGSREWSSKIKYDVLRRFEGQELSAQYKYRTVSWPPVMYSLEGACQEEDKGRAGHRGNDCKARHERQDYYAALPGGTHWQELGRRDVPKMKGSHTEGKAIAQVRPAGVRKNVRKTAKKDHERAVRRGLEEEHKRNSEEVVENGVETSVQEDLEKEVEKEVEKGTEKDVEKDVENSVQKDAEKDVGKDVEKDIETELEKELAKSIEEKDAKTADEVIDKGGVKKIKTSSKQEVKMDAQKDDKKGSEKGSESKALSTS